MRGRLLAIIAFATAVGLVLGWALLIVWSTFILEMRLGQNHLIRNDPLVKAGAWGPDPKFKDAETRNIVMTTPWFTLATNQRRLPPYPISAYGDIKITSRPALWGTIAASFMVPVGLALAAWLRALPNRPAPPSLTRASNA